MHAVAGSVDGDDDGVVDHAVHDGGGDYRIAQVVGKGEARTTPSPLSQWGLFPIFPGEQLSSTGRSRPVGPKLRAHRTTLQWEVEGSKAHRQLKIPAPAYPHVRDPCVGHVAAVGHGEPFVLHAPDSPAYPPVQRPIPLQGASSLDAAGDPGLLQRIA